MSTGIEKGIAFPHARSHEVSDVCVAVGIKKNGVDFKSQDGQPSKIFVMIVSPDADSSPLMRVMAAFSGALMHAEINDKLLDAKTPEEVINVLKEAKK